MSIAPDIAVRPARLTVEEYLRAADAGAFAHRTQRTELLNGRVRFMSPQGHRHNLAVMRFGRLFGKIAPADELLMTQSTMQLGEYSAVDPDLIWIPCGEKTTRKDWPLPVLLVEVSQTTYRYDSGSKLCRYAYRGVSDYWIVNLKADRIEVYRDPQNPTGKRAGCYYAACRHYARGQAIALLNRPDITVNVDDLLPA